jgi:hypothetical protein
MKQALPAGVLAPFKAAGATPTITCKRPMRVFWMSHVLQVADLVTIPALADEIEGNRISVWRWATKGLKLPDGRRLRLRTVRAGSVLLTSRRWYGEFRKRRRLARARA